MVFRLIISIYIFVIPNSVFYIFFLFCVFEFIRAWFLWPITCTILDFFMNLTPIVIIKGKMLYCTSFCSFELLCFLGCSCALYCTSSLTLLTVSSIITLFPTVHISSISEPLLLLWSLLKRLFLLKSMVWPLFPQFLFIGTLTFRFLRPIVAIHILRFLHTAKIHWFWTSILLSC